MIVDMHNHGVPPAAIEHLRREPERYGAEVADGPAGPVVRFCDGARLTVLPAMLDLEGRSEALARRGMDGAVLSVWIDFHRSACRRRRVAPSPDS